MNIAALELWALRIAAILALLAGMYVKGCTDGTRHQKEVEAIRETLRTTEEEKQSAKNQLESTNRQNDVLVAEAVAGQAQKDLADYRRTHALRGVLSGCVLNKATPSDSASACAGAGDSKAIAACQAARLLQPQGTRDPGSELDDLLAEADSINDSYSVCLATRKPVAPQAISR